MKYKQEMKEPLRLISSAQEVLSNVLSCINGTDTGESFDIEDFKLNQNKTLQNYIEGESNKLARKIGYAIAKNPGQQEYNPFYVFGPSGCGKSHLINAIGLMCIEHKPDLRVIYVTAQQFQRQFTDAVRYNTMNDFMNLYRATDMLIVDDIQEWKNMHKTVDAFLNIFNYLMDHDKQAILASDCSLVKLEGIKKSLLNRFASGVVVELEKPDAKLCIDFLNRKCHKEGLKIPAEIVEHIANAANSSIRKLEGIANSLKVYSSVNQVDIDMDIAKHIVENFVKLK